MKVAVVSALYGGYDTPKPFPSDDIEAVLVSDVPIDISGWRNIVAPSEEADPRMAAKYAKCRPDLYVEADIIVWLDASIEVRDSQVIDDLVSGLGDGLFGAYRHTFNHTIKSEALCASNVAEKYDNADLFGQVAHYEAQGHPKRWGMWTSGVHVRRIDDVTRRFGDEWLAEMKRWGVEDQISLPFVLRNNDITPIDLPHPGWDNPRFILRPHTR